MVAKLRENSPSLWDGAKCHQLTITREHDPFFSEDEDEQQEAVDFCNGGADGIVCPIREKCLFFALVNNEKSGVWGGCSPLTRKAIRKKFPSKGGKPHENWQWMSENEALEGLNAQKLKKELDEETRN